MLIEYFSDGLKLFARVYDSSGYDEYYTLGYLGDGSAESGIIDLHKFLLTYY